MIQKSTIKMVSAREILDSRGNPTIQAKVVLNGGGVGVASVPSGASTGSHEAWELRDGGKRHNGKGVKKAVNNVNKKIFPKVRGLDVLKIRKVDQAMIKIDGTPNKSNLGANAILAVSLACTRAGADQFKRPLYRHIRQIFNLNLKSYKFPLPMMNVINGGEHAANIIAFQEYMIIPKGRSIADRVWKGAQVFDALKQLLKKDHHITAVGDEGGFAPDFKDVGYKANEFAFEYINKAILKAGFVPGKDICLASDPAASEFYRKVSNSYDLDYKRKTKNKHKFTAKEMTELWRAWIKKYHVISIEDPLDEEAWDDWQYFTRQLGKQVQIVGDDLFVTNVERLQKGIEMGVANAILIKVNQIGTLSESVDAINLAREKGYNVVISHRSGETCDTIISDLSVAVNAEYIKAGSLSRSDRVEKYNRLMEIEMELKGNW